MCGAIGEVDNGLSASRFIKSMEKSNLSTSLVIQGEMKTTTKSRVIVKRQQVVRFDYEDSELSENMLKKIEGKLKCLDFNEIDLIVVSDYKKGVITKDVMGILKDTGVKIVVDPKPSNDNLYEGVFCMTPNLREFNLMTNENFHKDNLEDIEKATDVYRKKMNLDSMIVTLGEQGALCCVEDRCEIISNSKVEVANTIGAGDTFISALCLKLAEGEDVFESVRIANIAASIVVSKRYTGVCTMEEINKYRRLQNG